MRLAVLLLAVIVLQGLLPVLLSPWRLPVPDLLFLLCLGLSLYLEGHQALVLAFGIGLFQDLAAAGPIGTHSLALVVTTYLARVGQGVLSWNERASRLPVVALLNLIKGLLILGANWLRQVDTPPRWVFAGLFPLETLLTALLAPLVLRTVAWAMGGSPR